MKLKKLKLKNFAKFADFEIEFNKDVTRLVGVNGAGKTTVGLTAIWAGLKGIAERSKGGQLLGHRYKFIGGSGATANIELTLIDQAKDLEVRVTNHISKSGNAITFAPIRGTFDGADWLTNLLNVAFLSAKNFASMSPLQQALELGVNTGTYDEKLDELKQDYTLLNRELKGMGNLTPAEKVDAVKTAELVAERDLMTAYNKTQTDRAGYIANLQETEAELYQEIEDLKEDLKEAEKALEEHRQVLVDAPKPEKDKDDAVIVQDTTDINARIQTADETNTKAAAYTAYLEKQKKQKAKVAEVEANTKKQDAAKLERLDYIKAFNFGFAGLDVDETGGLQLNGRPIKDPYYSKGELEIIVAKLHAASNPALRVRFIDDFELLDEQNQKKVVDGLLAAGFQVITAEVGDAKKTDDAILLRECKTVATGQEKENPKLF